MLGFILLAAGLAALAIELVLAGVWSRRLLIRSRQLEGLIASERSATEAAVQRLTRTLEETKTLWLPYGRALRRLRHPLVLALVRSFARRAAAAR